MVSAGVYLTQASSRFCAQSIPPPAGFSSLLTSETTRKPRDSLGLLIDPLCISCRLCFYWKSAGRKFKFIWILKALWELMRQSLSRDIYKRFWTPNTWELGEQSSEVSPITLFWNSLAGQVLLNGQDHDMVHVGQSLSCQCSEFCEPSQRKLQPRGWTD